MSKQSKSEKVWSWFQENSKRLESFPTLEESKQEQLENEFLKHIHAFNDGLFFEVDEEENGYALTITAEGDADLFSHVEELVASAPKVENWTIHNLRQPLGTEVVSEYEDLLFDPEETVFIPLVNEQDPFAVGIEVCYDDYTKQKHDEWLIGTFMMLDTVIGEKATALDIDYVSVRDTPKDIENMDYYAVAEIGEYIAEVKGRKSDD
ncbi:MAG: hypothetical protein NXI20_10510 [bacterium]|nr:hypothetical protein [bacterium]